MSINLISVRQMLSEMETGVPFRIKGVTYNRKQRSGGEVYEFEAQLIQAEEGVKHNPRTDPQRPLTHTEQHPYGRPYVVAPNRPTMGAPRSTTNPNHLQWFTRNVAICQNGQRTSIIRKVHIPLVVYYNGKIVVP